MAELEADPTKLPSILYRLRLKAQTALIERGVNVLFVALGQLEWAESDGTAQSLRSPLILVPVELTRETLREPYKLRALDDETVFNPALVERLRSDFGIDLGMDSDEVADLTLDAVCQRVRSAIVHKRGWQVHADVAYLGLFSFLKMSMYKELVSAAAIAARSPIIQRLAGEAIDLQVPTGVPPATELDAKVAPNDSFNILDADASQLEAITYAKAGGNLVIQGPPGTGKSQTIANCIAECLAANKSVLFVSEKMAALDVVHKRLAQVGLSEFCLNAHSHKANKREIIRQLGDALARREIMASDGWASETLAGLQAARERLNQYVRVLHDRDNPLRRSAFDLHGEIAIRQSAPVLPFSLVNVPELTPAKLATIRECTQRLVARADVLQAGVRHPWYGCAAAAYSLELRAAVLFHFGALRDRLVDLREYGNAVASAIGVTPPGNLAETHAVNEVLSRARQVLLSGSALVGGAAASSPTDYVKALRTSVDVDPSAGLARRRDRVLAILRSSPAPEEAPTHDVVATRAATLDALTRLGQATERVIAAQAALQLHLDIEEALTFVGVQAVAELVSLLLRNPRAEHGWFDSGRLARAADVGRLATGHARVCANEGTAVQERFDPQIFTIAPTLVGPFTQTYTTIFRNVRPGYHRAMGALRRLAKDGRKIGYPEALAAVQQASRVAQSRHWLDEHRGELGDLLGLHYAGDATDWDDVGIALETTRGILLSRRASPLPEKLVALASRDGAAQAQLGDLQCELVGQSNEAGKQIERLVALLPWSWPQIASLSLPDLVTFVRDLADELTGLWDAEAAIRHVAVSPTATVFRDTLDRGDGELSFLGTLFSPTDMRIEDHPLREVPLDIFARWVTTRIEAIDDLDAWIACRTAVQAAGHLGLGDLVRFLQTGSAAPSTWIDATLRQTYQLCLDRLYHMQPVLREFRGDSHDDVVRRFRELDREAVRLGARRVRTTVMAAAPQLNGTPSNSSELGILLREVGKRARHKPLRRLFGEIPTVLRALKPCLMMSPLSLSQYLDPERIHFDVVIFDEASQIRPEDAVGAIMRGAQVVVAGDERQLPPTSFFSSLTPDSGEEWDEEAPEVYESILEACLSAGVTPKLLRWHYRSRDERLIAFSNRFIYDGRLITFPGARQDELGRGVSLVHVPDGVYDRSGTRTNQVEAARVVELVLDHAAAWVQRRHQYSLGVVAFSEAQQLAILQSLENRRRQRPDLETFFRERDDGEEFFVKNLENVQGDERDVMVFSIGYGRDSAGRLSMNFGPLNRTGGERRLNVAITRARDKVTVVSSITGADIDVTKTNAEGVRLLKRYLDYAEKGLSVLVQGQQATMGDYESPFEIAVARALERKGLIVRPQVGCAGFRIDLGIVHPEQAGRYVLGVECDGATYHRQATARDRDRLRQQVLEGLGWRIHRVWSRDWVHAPARETERVLEAYRQALAGDTDKPAKPEVTKVERSTPVPTPVPPAAPSATPPPTIVPVKATPQAAPYNSARLPRRGSKEQFYTTPITSLVDPITRCVREEGPVSVHVVRQRVAAVWEIERVGTTVARVLDEAIGLAVKRGMVRKRGEFLWPPEMTTPPVRFSGEGTGYRAISDVCPEEIDSGVLLVLANDFASARDGLVVAVARLLGYERAKQIVAERIGERIQALQQEGKLVARGEQISLPAVSGAKVS
jgi:very-short-patch-repair endonuclease